jgi:hypothetical protein
VLFRFRPVTRTGLVTRFPENTIGSSISKVNVFLHRGIFGHASEHALSGVARILPVLELFVRNMAVATWCMASLMAYESQPKSADKGEEGEEQKR